MTKLIMYGADACPDCVEAKEQLSKLGDAVELDYRDITKSLRHMKEFLSFRDHDERFAPVIRAGAIGIPFFVSEDQTRTFELGDLFPEAVSEQTESTCSLDGKGC